ncbi:SPAC24B11.05, partial [Cucurbita argyrosperma subsp. argyrosperma]
PLPPPLTLFLLPHLLYPLQFIATKSYKMPPFDCLLFDLDDTLYPVSSGLAAACKSNIHGYMGEKLGIENSKIPELSNLLYKNYGTSMAGLRAIGYDFDYDEYHRFVHGRLPYDNLKPDPILRTLLLSLPYRKLIFTNADKVHTAKVLNKLALEDCFEGIICFETLNPTKNRPILDEKQSSSTEIFDIIGHFSQTSPVMELPNTPIVCKPSKAAIEWALKIANIDPQRTVRTWPWN